MQRRHPRGDGGGYFVLNQFGDPYRTLTPLETAAYLENANSLRGNVYRVEGIVQNSLAWSPTKGRLISVSIGDGMSPDIVAVFVPADLNHINLQKGQRYRFKVEVIENGVIQARDLRKS